MSKVQARVLVSVFGSAGDLFPVIPVVQRLRQRGYDVRCAVSRSFSLYLRANFLPTYALGMGAEMRVLDDRRIVTNRFSGSASWRHTITDYVAPTLEGDVAGHCPVQPGLGERRSGSGARLVASDAATNRIVRHILERIT